MSPSKAPRASELHTALNNHAITKGHVLIPFPLASLRCIQVHLFIWFRTFWPGFAAAIDICEGIRTPGCIRLLPLLHFSASSSIR